MTHAVVQIEKTTPPEGDIALPVGYPLIGRIIEATLKRPQVMPRKWLVRVTIMLALTILVLNVIDKLCPWYLSWMEWLLFSVAFAILLFQKIGGNSVKDKKVKAQKVRNWVFCLNARVRTGDVVLLAYNELGSEVLTS